MADGGTIFLDEISATSLDLQSKLLRVLQEGEFERVGGTRTIHVDARVIAATNKDLHRAVDEGSFGADLFYRLNVFPIRLPPLRARKEDIPLLVRHFAARCGPKVGKEIDSSWTGWPRSFLPPAFIVTDTMGFLPPMRP